VNCGVSIVPAESVTQEIARGELTGKPLREMDEAGTIPIGLVYHPRQYRSRAAEAFIALARRQGR
jgi:DNA-binding transcriptional LysR family regulator